MRSDGGAKGLGCGKVESGAICVVWEPGLSGGVEGGMNGIRGVVRVCLMGFTCRQKAHPPLDDDKDTLKVQGTGKGENQCAVFVYGPRFATDGASL